MSRILLDKIPHQKIYTYPILGFKKIERDELWKRGGSIILKQGDLEVKIWDLLDLLILEEKDNKPLEQKMINFFKAKLRKELNKYNEWLELRKHKGVLI